ncbi:helix-turn-helix domain-containing protein [Chitinophaga eiseniae]|uniref:Helix-turn-helix transcriptional regulator n=1 Tax=Chitinophaga eiseniae TaxID=634771 RepID=A0A847SPT2_9BACT|nr:AraC family transcriptional regulator [Chitinophaga eiseniae]NLR82294.1 helix-turn-helix transcriptional regulator [Chitinophaga eiseniae]
MVTDYKKIDLFGKTFVQKVDVAPPFEYSFPVSQQACFLYMLKGETQFHRYDDHINIPTHHALLLNCLDSGKQIKDLNNSNSEIVIVTFHPDILRKIYERELPLIFQKNDKITNQSSGKINNDFLIQKYIEGLLFYFENPSLINDEILVLKLKEIILLLSQTQNAATIQVILSQLFSPTAYTFKEIIAANLFSQASVEELAQKTNLSTSSFKRESKKIYNDSPASYIKNKRLERAAELLLISDERITDIAFECGFNDLANFTKSFHDKYGVTPTGYRTNPPEYTRFS